MMMKKANKCFVMKLLIAIIIMAIALCGMIFYAHMSPTEITVQSLSNTSDGFLWNIDDKAKIKHSFVIRGWSCKKGEKIERVNCWIVLKDLETQRYFKIDTMLVERPETTLALADGKDYKKSGFIAKINKHFLEKGRSYQIYILYKNNDNHSILDTGHIIEN